MVLKKCKTCNSLLTKPKYPFIGSSKYCSLKCKPSPARKTSKPPKKPTERQNYVQIDLTPTITPPKKKNTLKPKELPERSQKYMAFIRTHPCLVCKTTKDIQAHHLFSKGLSEKGSDFHTIPLCHNCHISGNQAFHKIGLEKFALLNKIDYYKVMCKYLIRYINNVEN